MSCNTNRYKEAFHDYVDDGRNFFLVTHTLAVQAIGKKYLPKEKGLHYKHAEHGFYFFCNPRSSDLDTNSNSTSSFSRYSMHSTVDRVERMSLEGGRRVFMYRQIEGQVSAVPTPTLETKHSFQDIHALHTSAPLRTKRR